MANSKNLPTDYVQYSRLAKTTFKNQALPYLNRFAFRYRLAVSFKGIIAPEVGKTTADINQQIWQAQVPQLTKAYIAQGYDPDTAVKMAGSDVTKNLFKAQSSGKVVLTSNDGMSTISYTNEQAQKMWRDPSTPKFIKTQLNNFFGESEEPAAANWIKTRLGR
jgi:hypothetical protein